MAPKPPPAKGPPKAKKPPRPPPAKKPPPPPPAPAKTPRKRTKFEEFILGYNCATVGLLMLFCLFLYTLWYISLCAREKAKWDPLRNSVAQIRRFMITQDAAYGDLNDTDLILAAEKESRKLLPLAEKIKEIEAEIAELHYKLNHDWMAYKGFLYLPSRKTLNFEDTVKYCNESKAYIADILGDDEELFLEDLLLKQHGSYWIGLNSDNRRVWAWTVSQAKPVKTYWAERQPNLSFRRCVRMTNECTTKMKCWFSEDCSLSGRGVCKKKPENKWIN